MHENKTDNEVGNVDPAQVFDLGTPRENLALIGNRILKRDGQEPVAWWRECWNGDEGHKWQYVSEQNAGPEIARIDPMFSTVCAGTFRGIPEVDGVQRDQAIFISHDAWFDFDADPDKGVELSDAITGVQTFLGLLTARGVDPHCLDLHASGGKGFHVMAPLELFLEQGADSLRADDLPVLPLIIKELAEAFFVNTLDMRVYSRGRGRQWRRAGVRRPNDKFKVALTYEEVMAMTPELYASLTSAPRAEIARQSASLNSELALAWVKARDKGFNGFVKAQQRRQQAQAHPPSADELDRVKSALATLGPDADYADWRNCGAALHDFTGGSEEGFRVFDEWSQTGGKYRKKGQTTRQLWDHLRDDSAGVITVSTLFDLAYKAGWKDPRPDLNPSHNPVVNAAARPIQTELGMAEFLAKKYAPTLRFVEDMSNWLCWNGREWEFDGDGAKSTQIIGREARLLLAETLQAQAQEIKEAGDVDGKVLEAIRAKYAATVKFFTSMEGASRIRHVRELLQMQPELRIGSGLLDQHPGLLNLDNGVLILATGELGAHNANLLLTQRAFVEYAHEAQCPRWLQFMEEICCGDRELVDYLQCVMGYALSGDISRHEAYILHGDGANGKSVLVSTLRALMGGYCKAIDVNALMVRRDGSGPTPDLLAVRGARLVTTSEMSVGRQLNEGVFKDLVSGDTVPVRGMYAKQIIQMQFRCKIFMPTNALPTIAGQDYGVWRRIQPIPFNRTFTEAERDPGLKAKLKAELPGILAWCVTGYQRYKSKGFEAPACVREKKEAYRDDLDIVKHFVADALIQDEAGRQDTGKIPAAVLAQVYDHYCRTMNHPSMGGVRFGREVKKHLTEARRFVAGVKYIGWRVRPSWLPQRLRDELHAESLPEIMDALAEGEVQG